MEKNIEYFFMISFPKKETKLYRVWLYSNKSTCKELLGAVRDDILLNPIYETNFYDDSNALVYTLSISCEVKEFMIYLQSINNKTFYYSKVINVRNDLRNKSDDFVFFNFSLKFNDDPTSFVYQKAPVTIQIKPNKSFQIFRLILIDSKKDLRELYEFSLNYINSDFHLLLEILNSIKEQKNENLLKKLLNVIDFILLLSQLNQNPNLCNELKLIIEDGKIESILRDIENLNEHLISTDEIKYMKLLIIIYSDAKKSIPILKKLDSNEILNLIEIIISSEKVNFDYVMFLINFMIKQTRSEEKLLRYFVNQYIIFYKTLPLKEKIEFFKKIYENDNESESLKFGNKKTSLFEKGLISHFFSTNIEDFKLYFLQFLELFQDEKTKDFLEKKCYINLQIIFNEIHEKLKDFSNHEGILNFIFDLIEFQKKSKLIYFNNKFFDIKIKTVIVSIFKLDYDEFFYLNTINYKKFLDRLIDISKKFPELIKEIYNASTKNYLVVLIENAMNFPSDDENYFIKFSQINYFKSIVFITIKSLVLNNAKNLETLRNFVKFLSKDFISGLDKMEYRELITNLFKYFYSIEPRYYELAQLKEMHNLLLEMVTWNKENGLIMTYIFHYLMSFDYFKKYQIDKLIILNDNVHAFYNILENSNLDISKFYKIDEVIKFYIEEKLDCNNKNLVKIFSYLINIQQKLEKEHTFLFKSNSDFYKSIYCLRPFFLSPNVKISKYYDLMKEELKKTYLSVIEETIQIELLNKLNSIKLDPEEYEIKCEVMKLFLQDFQIDNFKKNLEEIINFSENLKTTFFELNQFGDSFLFDIISYQDEINKLREINSKINSYSIKEIKIINDNLKIKNLKSINDCIKLSSSKLFMEKFNHLKKNNENIDSREVAIENCLEYFKKFNIIFDANEITLKKIQDMFIHIKEKDLDNEMKILIDYLKINININDLNELKKTLTNILNYDEFKIEIDNLCKLVIYFEIKDIEFIQGLNIKLDNDFDCKISFKNFQEIQRELDKFEYYEIKSLIEEMIKAKTKLFDFLKDKTQNDLRQLNEFTDDIGDSFIKPSTIEDLIMILIFYKKLTNGIDQISDLEFYKKILVISRESNTENKHLDLIFKSVNENFNGIYQLFMKTANKEEFSKFKIQEFYSFSQFELKTNCQGYYIDVHYGINPNDENKRNTFKAEKFEFVVDLKNRSLVQAKKKVNPDINEQYIMSSKIYSDFCILVENIIELLEILNKLFIKGYPKIYLLKIICEEGKIHITENKEKYNNFDEYLSNLKSLFKDWTNTIKELYKAEYLTTFFHGRQLNKLWNYFNGLEENENQILMLFKYMINSDIESLNLEKVRYKYDKELNLKANFSSCLINCLKEVYSKLSKDMPISNKTNINEGKVFPLKIVDSENFDNILISTLLSKYKYLPCLNKILQCKSTTTKDEILSFLYRFYYSPQKSYFLVNKIDEFKYENKKYMLDNLIKLFKKKESIYSDLIIIYESSFDFIRQLSEVELIPYENLKQTSTDKFKMIAPEILKSCFLVSSDSSGIGKSTLIKEKAQEKKLELIYIPLSGEIDWHVIIKRLEIIKQSSQMIHFDLGDCSNYFIMKEFFSSILIFKGITIMNNVYFFDKYEIAVEISNTMTNFKEVFPFFKFLNEIKILNKYKKKFRITDDPKLQLVLNYLDAYRDKSIINKNIYVSCNCDKNVHSDLCLHYNSKALVQISEKDGLELLQNFGEINFYSSNFYQIQSFISILANQFSKYSKNYYFAVKILKENLMEKLDYNQNEVKSVLECRLSLVKYFIDLTKYFTNGTHDNIIQNNLIFQSQEKNDDAENSIDNLSTNKSISFNDIKHTLVFFNDDDMSISIINSLDPDDKEYKNLSNLISSSSKKEVKLKNYRKDKIDFFEESKKILNVNDSKHSFLDLNNYVFTSDNFIKLILIVLRLQSGIPVIMMGETGCGKTSLIKMLAKLKSNQESCSFKKTIKIVEGMNNEELIEAVSKLDDEARKDLLINFYVSIEGTSTQISKDLLDKLIYNNKLNCLTLSNNISFDFLKENIIIKTINIHSGINDDFLISEIGKIADQAKHKKLTNFWVFLDEINTTMSLGLISELICYKTILGSPLPQNIVFIGACNPYKESDNDRKSISKVGLETKFSKKLAYKVNPLPFRLLNFVFDFGYLTSEDEHKYISSMIQGRDFQGIPLECIIKSVSESQNFVKKNTEIRSVSLRDVHRFVDIFDWYKNSLYNRKEEISKICKISIIISFYISYYLRIEEKAIRKEYLNILAKYLNLSNDEIMQIIKNQQHDIINRIIVTKGIAKNGALLENIFVLFVCIFQKIPIIICGKPGCSKTLSLQLLYKSIKGKDSEDDYFKTLPNIFISSYQATRTSTSKGVQKVFDKAIQFQKESYKDEVISLVYFDELGVASFSPFDPLNVLHFTLEPERKEDKVAFVGISNWALDASIMNRLIFVSRPDLDLEDLLETSFVIAKSYKEGLENKYKYVFKAISESYFQYKTDIKESKNKEKCHVDFHGTRDFYSVIKHISKDISSRKNDDINPNELEKLIEKALERNFGGLPERVKMIKEIFNTKYERKTGEINPSNYNVYDCLNSNLKEEESRFLMMISESSISEPIIIPILKELVKDKDYIYLLGSEFKGDNEKNYTYKILNKIQIYMEQEKLLIINKLNQIYPCLYDLFNKNFTEIGGKNYCRIAVGTANNPLALVHKNFKCIVVMDQNDLSNQDAPFLNRFEKHCFSYGKLLSKKEIHLSNIILEDLNNLTISKDKKFVYEISNLKINMSESEILALVYKLKFQKIDIKDITNEIFKLLSAVLPQDIIVGLEDSKSNIDTKNKIKQYYDLIDHSSLKNYLSKIKSYSNKFMIYTFSSFSEKIILDNVNYHSIYLSSFNTEKDLENFFQEFLNNDKRLLLVRYTPKDCQLSINAKYLLEQMLRININENKYHKQIIFICHVERHLNDYISLNECIPNHTISYCSDWNFAFIDVLNGKINRSITEILNKNYKEIFLEELFNKFKIIRKIIYPVYINLMAFDNHALRDYGEDICSFIVNNEELIKILLEKISIHHILNTKWRDDILYDNAYIFSSGDIFSLIKVSFYKKIKNAFKIILSQLENNYLLDCLFYLDKFKENQNFKKLLDFSYKSIKNCKTEENKIIKLQEKIRFLKIPKFGFILKKIKEEVPFEEFKSKEDKMRNRKTEDNNDIDNILRIFERTKDEMVRSISKSLENNELFMELYNLIENKPDILDLMLQDYLHFYLSNIIQNYSQISHEFLHILLKFKIEKLQENCKIIVFSESILWLESNQTYIYHLIKSIEEIGKNKNFLKEFSVFIHKNKKSFPNDAKKKFKKIVNEVFYIFIDQIMSYLLEDLEKVLEKKDEQEFYDRLSIILNVFPNFRILNNSLKLFSTILIKFSFLIELISISTRKCNLNEIKENLLKILKFDNQNVNEESIDYIKEYTNLIDDLMIKLTKNQSNYSFAHLFNFFFINKFKENSNRIFRTNLLKLVLQNNFLKNHCKDFIFFIFCNFKEYEIQPPLPLINNDRFPEFLKDKEFLPIFEDNLSNNEYVREVLSYIFETKLNQFFDKLKINNRIFNPTNENNGILYQYFRSAIEQIESILYEKDCELNLKHLRSLYMITYIKSFINYIMKFLLDRVDRVQVEMNNLVEYLLRKKNYFRNSIFIFFLKIVRSRVINYDQFQKDLKELGLNQIFDQFETNENHLTTPSLSHNFSFLDQDTFIEFEELFKNKFGESGDLINTSDEKMIKYLTINPIFLILTCINKFFSNKKFINDEFRNFINWYQKNNEKFKYLCFEKFIKDENLISNLHSKDEKFLHMLIHSLVLSSVSFNSISQDNYFRKLNLTNIFDFLEDNYILGSEQKDGGKLERNYKLLVDHHNSYGSNVGAYLCKCQFFYTLETCGSPVQGSNIYCPDCKLLIGGHPDASHKLERGNGLYRIFKDKAQQEEVFKKYNNEDYEWKTLEDVKKELENEKFQSEERSISFNEMSLNEIKKNKKWTIRNLNPLSYRILSFLYNSLVYLSISENNKEKVNTIYLKSSPIELMETNYKIIEELLKEKGINNASLFLLLLENKILNLFNDIKSRSKEERKLEENNFNLFVDSCLNEFNERKEELKKITSNSTECDKFSLKSILEEKFDINSYDKINYPYLNDFTIKSLPKKEELIEIIKNDNDFSKKYPVMHLILINKYKLIQLECLLPMNKLVNLFMNSFSFNIDRQEAKRITIKSSFDRINPDSKILDKYLEEFNKSWENVKLNAIKFNNLQEMKVKDKFLKYTDTLSYLLNDIGDYENGMYIAAAYQYLISLQNNIISEIKNSLIQDISDKNYIKLLDEKVTIQDAKEINILKENYGMEIADLNELLLYYSIRNEDSKSINYNLKAMEKYLREAILIGIKTFKEKQKFVIYKYETYKGDNLSILTNFIKKYQQTSLNNEQKKIISEFSRKCENIIDVLSNLQTILYFTTAKYYEKETSLNEILNKLPDYINVNYRTQELLSNDFTLSNFRDLYEYVELYSFNELEREINSGFKFEIEPEIIKSLKDYFDNNPLNVVSKNELATILRRFIIRFLTSNLQIEEFGFDEEIIDIVNSIEDLWNIHIFNNENREKEMFELKKRFKLQVKHCFNLYMVLGEDSNLQIQEDEDEDEDLDKNSSDIEANEKNISRKSKNYDS